MKPPAPPRVDDIQRYWVEPPPEPSPRLLWWLERVRGGWIGNSRILTLGYYGCALHFGVYIWEWLNVLSPELHRVRAKAGCDD